MQNIKNKNNNYKYSKNKDVNKGRDVLKLDGIVTDIFPGQKFQIEFSNGQKAEFSELDKNKRLMFILDGNVKIKNMRVFGTEELAYANITDYKGYIPIYEANEYSKGWLYEKIIYFTICNNNALLWLRI